MDVAGPDSIGTGNQYRVAVWGGDTVVVERHGEGCTDVTFSLGESQGR